MLTTTQEPLGSYGQRVGEEGRQHHTGVTVTDSKLAFGSASKCASMKSRASSLHGGQ